MDNGSPTNIGYILIIWNKSDLFYNKLYILAKFIS